jgi:hypothetical protein
VIQTRDDEHKTDLDLDHAEGLGGCGDLGGPPSDDDLLLKNDLITIMPMLGIIKLDFYNRS